MNAKINQSELRSRKRWRSAKTSFQNSSCWRGRERAGGGFVLAHCAWCKKRKKEEEKSQRFRQKQLLNASSVNFQAGKIHARLQDIGMTQPQLDSTLAIPHKMKWHSWFAQANNSLNSYVALAEMTLILPRTDVERARNPWQGKARRWYQLAGRWMHYNLALILHKIIRKVIFSSDL